jgi:hypothetical protein
VRAAAGDSVDALAHASIGRGVARCITPIESNESGERLVAAAARFDGTVIFERLPTELWPRTRAENSTGESGTERLARGMRSSFDPMRVLNPGILGERTDEQR